MRKEAPIPPDVSKASLFDENGGANRRVAQMVCIEHFISNEGVGGSIPSPPTKFADVAQWAISRASRF
jgi:hypothetical protein